MIDLIFVVAMREEEDFLREAISKNKYFSQPMTLSRLRVICSGIGKVNAALALNTILTQDYYEDKVQATKYVVNVGFAGSLNDAYQVSDVVVPSSSLYHDVNVSTSFSNIYAPHYYITSAIKKSGTLATGDSFLAKPVFNVRDISPDFVDMECRAFSQVCSQKDIHFLPVKIISDNPNAENHNFNPKDPRFKQSFSEALTIVESTLREKAYPCIEVVDMCARYNF